MKPFAWLAVAVLIPFVLPAWRNPLLDPDLWWLLWSGGRILDGWLPDRNALSWVAPDQPWTSHEYLVAALYAGVGVESMALLRGIVVTATAGLVVVTVWRRECAWAGVLAIFWFAFMVAYGRTERALSVGNLLMAVEMALLVGPRRTWRLAAAALLVALWTSVHGSFVVGLLVLALADWRWGVAAALGTLANPYGWHVWELVVGYGTGADVRGQVHATVQEWMPPDPGDPATLGRLVCLGLAGLLLAWRRQTRALLLWAAVAILAARHVRFLDVAGIVLAPALADALAVLLPPRREPLQPWPLLAAAGLLVALRGTPGVDTSQYPPDLPFAELRGHRLWNDHSLGGYLGYHGVANFWDSRNDCVPAEVYADGVTIERESAGWLALLDRWRIDRVVTASPAKEDNLMAQGWRVTGRAGSVRILARPSSNP